jgi:hypothetical protein
VKQSYAHWVLELCRFNPLDSRWGQPKNDHLDC